MKKIVKIVVIGEMVVLHAALALGAYQIKKNNLTLVSAAKTALDNSPKK